MRLAGLEHLDERYLRAVGYATQSKRGALPKMVLLGDIVGDDEAAVAQYASDIVRIANARAGEGFIAASAEARKAFWRDRSRTAAIARHTNAFKVNEDVVIPLERLGEYTDAIERINIELSLKNKLALLDALETYLAGCSAHRQDRRRGHRPAAGRAKCSANVHASRSRSSRPPGDAGPGCSPSWIARWHSRRPNSRRWASARSLRNSRGEVAADPVVRVFDLLQDRTIRVSWKAEVRNELRRLFAGGPFGPLLDDLGAVQQKALRSRVFVALHMHAGDGNVHTNIPVNSDDYEMLQEANRAVARIMRVARELDGVISGEHGIGLTKLEFLDRRRDRRSSAPTRRASTRRAASTRASCCPAPTCARPIRRASTCSATSR